LVVGSSSDPEDGSTKGVRINTTGDEDREAEEPAVRRGSFTTAREDWDEAE